MLKALEDRNVPLRSLAMLRSAWEPWTCVTQPARLGAQEARCLEEGRQGFSSTCDVNVGSFTLMENLQKPICCMDFSLSSCVQQVSHLGRWGPSPPGPQSLSQLVLAA